MADDALVEKNYWQHDLNTQQLVRMYVDSSVRKELEEWLQQLGLIMATTVGPNADFIDKNPPRLVKYNCRGTGTRKTGGDEEENF